MLMRTLHQSLGTIGLVSILSSCTLDTLVSNANGEKSVVGDPKSSGNSSYARYSGLCQLPAMSCSFLENPVSNEEYASATVTCRVSSFSCIDTVSYNGNDLGTDYLIRSGLKVFVGSIDTEAVAEGTYTVDITGYDARLRSTTTTLSLDVVDLHGPEVVCATSSSANDGSKDLTLLCIIDDDTEMGEAYYISSLGSGYMENVSGSTYEAAFDVTGLPAGEQTITVLSWDAADNVTYTEVTGQISDELSPIVTSITTDKSYVLNIGSDSFSIEACFSDETDGPVLGGTVTAEIDSVVATLLYEPASECFVSPSIAGSNFPTTGTYPITVTGYDSAGNGVTDSSASIVVEEMCPYPCYSNICLYIDGNLEAELNTPFPVQMTAIDTFRLGYGGQHIDNVIAVIEGIVYVNEEFDSDRGCFTSGSVSSGVYVTSGTDNDCFFSPAFDASLTEWKVSLDVIAGSSPNFAFRSTSYSAPGFNWDFAANYANDGAGNSVSLASGTPSSSRDHIVVMCSNNI